MQEEKKKTSNFLGIPYVVIIFVFVSTAPALISDHFTRNDIKRSNDEVISAVASLRMKQLVTPTASPSAQPSVVPTKTLFTPKTSSTSGAK